MSLETLQELDRETRRLFIAGSKLARGDLRLTKLLPSVRKLGEASPVFARVAQAVEQTLEAGQEEADMRLLDLSALLNSILYTQGRTDVPGEVAALEGTDTFDYAMQPYRKLKPVIEALTVKGQGRMEVLRQACEEGAIRDYRLLLPAVAALEDSYAEIPEIAEEKIIPGFGQAALPALLRAFRPDGGKGDSRRLRLIHGMQGEAAKPLLLRTAEEGSPEVRATAIELLGSYADQESFLLAQAGEKRKEIRRAALLALANVGTPAASERIYKALVSKDRELAVEPIRMSADADLIRHALAYAKTVNRELTEEEAKKEEAWAPVQAVLDALGDRRFAESTELLKELFSNPLFAAHAPYWLQRTAGEHLKDDVGQDARSFAIALADNNRGRYLELSLYAAMRSLTPAEVYERFSKYKLTGKRKALAESMQMLLPTIADHLMREEPEESIPALDSRWLELFIEQDELEVVTRLANEFDKRTERYLLDKCEAKPDFTEDVIAHALLALFKIGSKQAPDMLIHVLETGKRRTIYYLYPQQRLLLGLLPGSYADRLEQYIEKLHYPSVREQVQEIVQELRAKPQEASGGGKGIMEWIKQRMS